MQAELSAACAPVPRRSDKECAWSARCRQPAASRAWSLLGRTGRGVSQPRGRAAGVWNTFILIFGAHAGLPFVAQAFTCRPLAVQCWRGGPAKSSGAAAGATQRDGATTPPADAVCCALVTARSGKPPSGCLHLTCSRLLG